MKYCHIILFIIVGSLFIWGTSPLRAGDAYIGINSSAGASGEGFDDENIAYSAFTAPEAGTLDTVYVYLWLLIIQSGSPHQASVYIYNADGDSLIERIDRNLSDDGSAKWFTFTLAEPYEIDEDESITLSVQVESGWAVMQTFIVDSTGINAHADYESSCCTPPASLDDDASQSDKALVIYGHIATPEDAIVNELRSPEGTAVLRSPERNSVLREP